MIDLLRSLALSLLWSLEAIAAGHHWLYLAATACHAASSLGAFGPCLR